MGSGVGYGRVAAFAGETGEIIRNADFFVWQGCPTGWLQQAIEVETKPSDDKGVYYSVQPLPDATRPWHEASRHT